MIMRNVVSAAALTLTITMGCPVEAEVDPQSGDYILEACRTFLDVEDKEDSFLQGACFGAIRTLIWVGSDIGVCVPSDVTSAQAVRVFVDYADEHEDRLHENYRQLMLEALREAWPCKK